MHHSQTLPFAQPKTRSSRHVLLGAAALAGLTAFGLPAARAGMPAGDPRLLPPISLRTSLILKAHPEMRRAMQWALAHPGPATPRQLATTGGSWQAVTTAPVSGLTTPELQTDGTVLVHNGNSPSWYRLTPDGSGNYVHGTWSQIASLPVIGGTQYAPLYHATAVLPDGRTVVMGGEYNGSSTEAFTSLGAIYDPVANSWTAVAAPSGWSGIGDAQSTILANGAFLLASCCGNPAADAILDPVTLTWSATGAPSAGDNYQDEQGYELLPNKDVLTIDIWTNYPTRGNATNAERYLPASGSWASAGDTPIGAPDSSWR